MLCFQAQAKNIAIIATGGTISGSGDSSTESKYSSSKIDITNIINRIPNISQLATIQAEQLIQVSSQDIDEKLWLKIVKRANDLLKQSDVDGLVITHGTDTMEETAYFLNLAIKSKKPVVLTGAMHPSTSISPDGALNLFNAVAVAADNQSYNKGVMVVMNDEIFAARDVTKTHTTNLAAFSARNGGLIGSVHYGKVKIYYKPLRNHTASTIFKLDNYDSLPKVDIIYCYSSGNYDIIDHLIKSGTQALVIAGVGDGNINKDILQKLSQLQKLGIIIIRSSRVGSGNVESEAEINDVENGFISSDNLSPQKARILAMLALTKGNNIKEIRNIFAQY